MSPHPPPDTKALALHTQECLASEGIHIELHEIERSLAKEFAWLSLTGFTSPERVNMPVDAKRPGSL